MGADELAYMSAAEIAERVRRRTLSPVEIVDACIARIERRNPTLNAFVFKGFEDARREAKAAEAAVMSGAPHCVRCMGCLRRSRISSTSSRVGRSPSAASGR